MAEDILGFEGGAGEGEGAGAEGGAGAGAGAQDAGNNGAGPGAGEGGEHPKWHGVLPKEYQGHEALKDVEGMDQLLKGFVDRKGLDGAIVVPGKDASDEVKAAFFKHLGVPDKSAEYEGDIQDVYKQLFHNARLNQKQAETIVKGHQAIDAETKKAEQAAKDEAIEKAKEALKTDYGPDYDKNVNIATKALKNYMTEDAFKRLKEKGFTSDPDVVEMFYRVGKSTLDDSVLTGTGGKKAGDRPKDASGRSTFSFTATK